MKLVVNPDTTPPDRAPFTDAVLVTDDVAVALGRRRDGEIYDWSLTFESDYETVLISGRGFSVNYDEWGDPVLSSNAAVKWVDYPLNGGDFGGTKTYKASIGTITVETVTASDDRYIWDAWDIKTAVSAATPPRLIPSPLYSPPAGSEVIGLAVTLRWVDQSNPAIIEAVEQFVANPGVFLPTAIGPYGGGAIDQTWTVGPNTVALTIDTIPDPQSQCRNTAAWTTTVTWDGSNYDYRYSNYLVVVTYTWETWRDTGTETATVTLKPAGYVQWANEGTFTRIPQDAGITLITLSDLIIDP